MITGKSSAMLELLSRDKRNVFSHNYRKLNDRQPRYMYINRQIFKVCNMPKLSLATCCKVLQEIATIQKSQTMSPPNQRLKSKRLKCVRKYKKMNFSKAIFINKCHYLLMNSDNKPPLINDSSYIGVMFWLAILMMVV